jgi:phosphohistidine phosphatase SixA
MDLYLMRHAKPDGSSDDAPLGDEGKKQAEVLAGLLDKLSLPRERMIIISSEYKRAKGTAEIICEKLSVPLADIKFPAPIDLQNANLREKLLKMLEQIRIEKALDTAIVVGHAPYIPEVTTWLTGVQITKETFSYGATAYVKWDNSLSQGSGKLLWLIIPELLLKQ